ncbi:hypothetical protein U6A24_06125 [Aquimarina gracilis]|uniref:Periplasmic nitrate reductase chaperone NapD n=1 Tax=Aquimarina gracilis TaxID=874422 RepID=A0ABU5ZSK6_9FLAO|nr:hypothetical protein [Aquimarina gracilis]MEB3345027.1 hypothetical protein [Aquimarina gracilis]
MPIKSYLAHPYSGKKDELIQALSSIKQCEIMPAQNKDLLILVTETNNEAEEDILKEKLDTIDSLKLLALVSGFNTPQNH